MDFKNFKEYRPSTPTFGENALYLKDDEDNDWYDIQSLLTKNYIFAYESETGIVRCISDSASKMYPVNFSVSETDEVPEAFSIAGNWKYENGEIIKIDL